MSTDASYRAIAQVGTTLVDRLYEGISARMDFQRREIGLASPDQVGGTLRVTVYLYEVTRNAHLLNTQRGTAAADGEDAPEHDQFWVDLHYLVTAHPTGGQSDDGGDVTTRTATQHELLGLVVQTVHENQILRAADLPGDFAGREVQLSMESRSTNELTNVWSTFEDQPYRPSVAYEVTPVVVESPPPSEGGPVVEGRIEEYT